MPSLLLLALAACLLCAAPAAAEKEAFNGAVHSDNGRDADDGMTEVPFANADWKDLALSPRFVTRKSWQVPQYYAAGDYVRLRGWLIASAAVAAGEAGPASYCSPRYPTLFEPSFLDLHGIHRRGEQRLAGPRARWCSGCRRRRGPCGARRGR